MLPRTNRAQVRYRLYGFAFGGGFLLLLLVASRVFARSIVKRIERRRVREREGKGVCTRMCFANTGIHHGVRSFAFLSHSPQLF